MSAMREIANLRTRVDELLQANNREVERRREAEARVRSLEPYIKIHAWAAQLLIENSSGRVAGEIVHDMGNYGSWLAEVESLVETVLFSSAAANCATINDETLAEEVGRLTSLASAIMDALLWFGALPTAEQFKARA